MLDQKYALKYQMPHSIVHIVDNSANTGASAPVVVDDPSLYAAIVVTGAPIGLDNQMVTITRSDIASVAFGLGNITTDDIKRYGQTIEYPMSLLTRAGVPVRFMRVTPDGSKYAVSSVLVQWRKNESGEGGKSQLDVRFQTLDPNLLTSLRLDRFKNPARLNAAIIANVDKEVEINGVKWNQRVFMNIISAGRGKAYNDFVFAIDLGNQQKKAANCRYVFSTINSLTTQVVEQFSASLVNNATNTVNMTSNPIESANVLVGRRVTGSSILVPFVNESAIGEVYTAWDNLCKSESASFEETELRLWKTTNINTFDILFGTYVYDGAEYEMNLPRYHVQMENNNIRKLDENHRLTIADADYAANGPTVLYDKLMENTKGINDGDSSIYVGDVYVTPMGGYARPLVSFVATLNQYTGYVTTMNVSGIDVSATETPDIREIIAYFDDVEGLIIDGALTPSEDPSPADIVNGSSVLKKLVANGTIATPSTGTADVYVAYVAAGAVYFLKLTIDSTGAFTAVALLDFKTQVLPKMKLTASQTQKLVIFEDSGVADPTYPVGATVIGTSGDVYVVWYDGSTLIRVAAVPAFDTNKFYFTEAEGGTAITTKPADWETNYANYYVADTEQGARIPVAYADSNGAKFGEVPTSFAVTFDIMGVDYDIMSYASVPPAATDIPTDIYRWEVTGTIGSLYRAQDTGVDIPRDYYTADYGVNPTAESGGLQMLGGSTGFFDNAISDIEFKYRYSALLVKAYRGLIDPSIMSPIRCSAKFLFDGGTNTVVGQTLLPNTQYDVNTMINASTIFTDEEKEAILLDPTIGTDIAKWSDDIDVKQAMYDLMIERVYLRIPEDKRPIGPGYGLELHLDSGMCEAETIAVINNSFNRRFTNSNCSWDMGGYVSSANAMSYTYIKKIVDDMIPYLKRTTINKPFANGITAIAPNEYISYFPNIDMTDWELRNKGYLLGGNMWVPDINGNIIRTAQRTMKTDNTTSDLIQENNMRTLSQLCYLLQNKIDSKLFEYYDDDVLKSMKTECELMFINWVGSRVDKLDINFTRDINPTDGGEVVVCWVVVVFRGLILRVPIIVDVQRRVQS